MTTAAVSSSASDVCRTKPHLAAPAAAVTSESACSSLTQTMVAPSSPPSAMASSYPMHAAGAIKGTPRKKGIPWTEDEHKLFLLGLQKLGKGDWRGISWHFVQTRTPTQVASHAQKYFIRQSNSSKRKKRASLFDMSPSVSECEEPVLKKQAIADKPRVPPGRQQTPVEQIRESPKSVPEDDCWSPAVSSAATAAPVALPAPGPEANFRASIQSLYYPGGAHGNPMYMQPHLAGAGDFRIPFAHHGQHLMLDTSSAALMPWFYAHNQMLAATGQLHMPLLPPVSAVVPPLPKKSKAVSDIAVKIHRPVAALPRIITGQHKLPRTLLPLSLSMPLETKAT